MHISVDAQVRPFRPARYDDVAMAGVRGRGSDWGGAVFGSVVGAAQPRQAGWAMKMIKRRSAARFGVDRAS
jgi:hypothetical protein